MSKYLLLYQNVVDAKCKNCKYYSQDENRFSYCDIEGCKYTVPIYDPLHMKYCEDCYYFIQSNHICVKENLQVDSVAKPCKNFHYVRKSYSCKSS